MRILYIDIDSLRPDHLGCYGYHRDTSPAIDSIAARGVRFDNVHVSDAPCLPSRTALLTGRFGIHTGVVNHGGLAADPHLEGAGRGFRSLLGRTSLFAAFREAGYRTVSVSPFAERHSAWHWTAGLNELHNTGEGGMEVAGTVARVALDWLDRNAASDNWFLHVNLWDPHTPYRTPIAEAHPFDRDPLPDWLTEEVRARHWEGCGPHSAREVRGFLASPHEQERYPLQPGEMASMADVRRMFDGYDMGVRHADDHVAMLLAALERAGVADDTAILVSADHGENLGELNIYGDHQTADAITTHVPMIVAWPRVTDRFAGSSDPGLHYQFDVAATLVELAGGRVPSGWDARSFEPALRVGATEGREYLVVSQGAWSCQRAVRWGDWVCIRSYHDGYHGFPETMLFDVVRDPHEQHDLAPERPDLVQEAASRLEEWHGEVMRTATHPVDPFWTVLAEGGPLHTRGQLPAYLDRLRATGRAGWAELLASRYPAHARA
jgi:choline-sulfatase